MLPTPFGFQLLERCSGPLDGDGAAARMFELVAAGFGVTLLPRASPRAPAVGVVTIVRR
jgi:hypothetical protein